MTQKTTLSTKTLPNLWSKLGRDKAALRLRAQIRSEDRAEAKEEKKARRAKKSRKQHVKKFMKNFFRLRTAEKIKGMYR